MLNVWGEVREEVRKGEEAWRLEGRRGTVLCALPGGEVWEQVWEEFRKAEEAWRLKGHRGALLCALPGAEVWEVWEEVWEGVLGRVWERKEGLEGAQAVGCSTHHKSSVHAMVPNANGHSPPHFPHFSPRC